LLLDTTPIGKLLDGLYECLNEKHKNLDKKDKKTAVDADGQYIMREVSLLFIRAAHGNIETAVCGADKNRVFRKDELYAVLDPDNVTFIMPKKPKALLMNFVQSMTSRPSTR